MSMGSVRLSCTSRPEGCSVAPLSDCNLKKFKFSKWPLRPLGDEAPHELEAEYHTDQAACGMQIPAIYCQLQAALY